MPAKSIILFLAIASILFGDHFFIDKRGETVRIAAVKASSEVVKEEGKQILVAGFMTAYEDIPLAELNPSFKSTGDVRRFYKDYFDSEFAEFEHGSLIWVQAFIGEKLVGWATFELEEQNQAYMNLLVVDPLYQKRGIGEQLVFSICSEELFPQIEAINILLRKINEGGRQFYHRIGFRDCPEYQRKENFVDPNLLTPIQWRKF